MSHLSTIETLQRENGQLIEEITRLRGATVPGLIDLVNACRKIGFPMVTRDCQNYVHEMQKALRIVQSAIKFNPLKPLTTAAAAGYSSENWQPIETAPTEPHSTAIIYAPSDTHDGTAGEAVLGKDGQWYWAGSEVGYHDPITDCNSPPTHWMPMPAKPKSQEAA